MVKDNASAREAALRPLDLNPERAGSRRSRALRDCRHRVEFGSPGRLRSAWPRAAAALQRKVAVPSRRWTCADRRDRSGRLSPHRRGGAPISRDRRCDGRDRIDATATEAIRRAPMDRARSRRSAAEAGVEVRILSAERRKPAMRRSASSLASSARSGSWAIWEAAVSKSPRRSTIASAIAGSVCRSAHCRSNGVAGEGPTPSAASMHC